MNTEQIEALNILIDYLHHRAGKLEIRLPWWGFQRRSKGSR